MSADSSPAPSGLSVLKVGCHPAVRAALLALAVLAACGVVRVKTGNNPADFYRPPAFLAEGEKLFHTLNGGDGARFCLVEGANVQEALEREEAAGVKGLSAFIPSLKRQRANAALVARLRAETRARYTALTGVPVREPDAPQEFLDPDTLDDPLLLKLVRPMLVRLPDEGKVLLVSANTKPAVAGVPGVSLFHPGEALTALFDAAARETARLLAVSFALLVLLMAALFRRRAPAYLLCVGAAALATLGALGWLGVTVNFFHALCFFVFVGLGLDYTIFHRASSDAAVRRTVFVSFLTSFSSFALLAFTSFAVTASMGLTLALGLLFAYALSRFGGTDAPDNAPPPAAARGWFEQREQSAGALRLAVLWLVYRVCGKTVLKLVIAAVVAFVYPFAASARRNLRAFYRALGMRRPRLFRHILGFAWSLADKLDACTLRRALPKMTVRDDAGARAFFALTDAGRGAFLISSHLGTIEVFPALPPRAGARAPRVHAFQQLGHNAHFTRLFTRHFDPSVFTLHAVEDIGVETAVSMQEAIARGELVLMAGDRVSAAAPRAVIQRTFLGRSCAWPKGVFVFARLMEAPVFFVTCVRTGWNAYECRFARAPEGADLADAYVRFLEAETRACPGQWYHFHDFFSESNPAC